MYEMYTAKYTEAVDSNQDTFRVESHEISYLVQDDFRCNEMA